MFFNIFSLFFDKCSYLLYSNLNFNLSYWFLFSFNEFFDSFYPFFVVSLNSLCDSCLEGLWSFFLSDWVFYFLFPLLMSFFSYFSDELESNFFEMFIECFYLNFIFFHFPEVIYFNFSSFNCKFHFLTLFFINFFLPFIEYFSQVFSSFTLVVRLFSNFLSGHLFLYFLILFFEVFLFFVDYFSLFFFNFLLFFMYFLELFLIFLQFYVLSVLSILYFLDDFS